MTRTHPFDFVVGDRAESWFGPLRDDAPEAHVDLAAFSRLPATQALLREVGSPDLADADPAAVTEYLLFLFVAFRYWAAGGITRSIERSVLQSTLDTWPDRPFPAVDTVYLQLPSPWWWAQVGPDRPHEPLDGMFVVGSPDGAAVTVLAVLGFRAEREGFSQIAVTAAPADLPAARAAARTPPFAPVMDGGTAAGFHSVTSTGELLSLTHLALISANG